MMSRNNIGYELQTTPLLCAISNGSDHAVIACYLGLYEEDKVKHINGPILSCPVTLIHLACYQKVKV